ncbi:universal stress protein [Olleya aquimaris]|uniref:Nucleotide-binding universal stress UspA family protein n=1 Tax=Olleya aquimaris TaxID=639310 RepID=A0A327RIN7_9FLAO|nr:universal stress protein [Olleya aquimaris]RAJ16411.1 nucleotide-binding universal stress UspA family protein [Olleya aquimaris]
MKNILLLTDFSESSKNAIHYALQLLEAQTLKCHLVYVHKASTFTSADLMTTGNDNLYASIVKSPKEDLEDLMATLQNNYKNNNHTFSIHIDYDVFTDAINQLVELQTIDLIVMGTNGVTGADEVVFGSNTLNVIRKVNCPTLIIPKDYNFAKPKEVLIPLDENDELNSKRLQVILELVDKKDAKYHILRITESAENNSITAKDAKALKSLFKASDYDYHNITNVPMHHVVDTYVQTHAIDFEVFIIQKTSFLERLFSGSPITKHSKIASIPLFILHD